MIKWSYGKWLENLVPANGDMSYMQYNDASGFTAPSHNSLSIPAGYRGIIVGNCTNKTTLAISNQEGTIALIHNDGTLTYQYTGNSSVDVSSYDYFLIAFWTRYGTAGTWVLS